MSSQTMLLLLVVFLLLSITFGKCLKPPANIIFGPKVAPEYGAMFRWVATATHHSSAQGGYAICGSEPGNCGASSDGSQF